MSNGEFRISNAMIDGGLIQVLVAYGIFVVLPVCLAVLSLMYLFKLFKNLFRKSNSLPNSDTVQNGRPDGPETGSEQSIYND
jgi:hypothetical protein